jgi:GNAT superfamily N-acetyltransferase
MKRGAKNDNDQVEITIRFAASSDAPALARLRYELRSTTGVATENKTFFLDRCAVWMEQHLGEPGRWHCWLAETREEAIGCLWLQLVEKIPNPRSEAEQHAYITSVYVRESSRGKGIGSRLLDEAISWCRTRDVHAIILWPSERSRRLYKRKGFAVREDILELIIDEPAG